MTEQETTLDKLQRRIGRLEPEQIVAWRKMSGGRRLDLAFQAYQFALDAVRLTEKKRHPTLSTDELAWRVTRRMQGNSYSVFRISRTAIVS